MSLDNDALLKILTKLSQGQDDHTQAMHNTNIRVDQLEKQIGQIADFVGKFRDQGQLPSSTIPNPKEGFKSAKAITLRSGKEVGTGPTPSKSGHKEDEKLQFEKEESSQPTAKVETPLPQVSMAPKPSNLSNKGKNVLNSVPTNVFPSNVPFPSRFLQSKNEEEEKLVRVLKEFKSALGWTLAYIKGISPTTCMHHIFLEERAKPTREAQCRLNPPMMEVVKKEIIKLLDCGVIYPISDSRSVSPIQCVPKKSGVTVVENAENELVPTRIQTGWRVCIDYRKLKRHHKEGSLPIAIPRSNARKVSGSFLLLLS
ncbi:hypothetical protein FF1_046678 [Malus domestica]